MKHSLVLFCVLISFLGCKSNPTENTNSSIPVGTYSGTFTYQSNSDSIAVTAQFIFDEMSYSCSSAETTVTYRTYSLSSAGNYNVAHSTVTFVDTAAHLVSSLRKILCLGGIYSFSMNGNNLLLTQNNDSTKCIMNFDLTRKE
jgi:hypothetical protein